MLVVRLELVSIGYSKYFTDIALLTVVVMYLEKFNFLFTWRPRYFIELNHFMPLFFEFRLKGSGSVSVRKHYR